MSAAPPPEESSFELPEACRRFARWCMENPLAAALLVGCLGTFVWFYFFVPIWVNGHESTARWAWKAWSGEQAHGLLVVPASIFLVWYHRYRILAVPKDSSNWGLLWLVLGIVLFLVGARCLQPRMALFATPFLFYGATLFLWGPRVARISLFPCVFLVFMIPVAAFEQATFKLQFLITGTIDVLSRLVGIGIKAVGTTLTARDGSFNFEIAEGCSGVRSLTAMSMLTAIYVHVTQDRLWKKAVIFSASLLFAVFGNVGRLFTIILFAKFINPDLAAGLYHDYSGFLFFPIGVLAMTGFSRLVNIDWKQFAARLMKTEKPPSFDYSAPAAKPAAKSADPISYDY
jgi:exosortase